MRILMVRLSSIGDLVHTLPALAALRSHDPGASVDWLVESKFREILSTTEGIDHLVEVDTFRWRRGWYRPAIWAEVWKAVARLRSKDYDVVLDLQGTIKSAVASWLARGDRHIGFAKSALKETPAAWLYGETVTVNGAPAHVIDRHLRLLSALGIDEDERAFPIAVPESMSSEAERELERLALSEFVLLNPGGSWATKRWSPRKFGELAVRIRAELELASLVLWGPGDEAMAKAILDTSDGAATLAPPTGVLSMIPYARKARLLVSGDTGPMHIASAFGVPIVGIFGPTDPARNGPFGTGDEIVYRDAPCGPCYKHRCPGYDNVCMTEIEVDDVMAAVRRRLARD